MDDFENYKQEVIRIMRIAGWNEKAIASVDWKAWKESHYNAGDTPAEGFQDEMSNF